MSKPFETEKSAVDGFRPHVSLKICIFIAVLLAGAMTFVSNFNTHPDEVHHFEAVKYYVRHFLPPTIGDPEVRASYSVWGVSYLDLQWAEYLLAGKFVMLLAPLVGNELAAARTFQLALFLGLASIFTFLSRTDPARFIFVSLLLITPQVWYVFSYVNNDAFALVISLLLCYQAAFDGSRFRRFLRGEARWGGIAFGLLAGLQLIGKTNYWVVLIFLALWLAVEVPRDLVTLKKYSIVAAVAFAVLGIRVGMDLYVNGETNFAGLSYVSYLTGTGDPGRRKLTAYQEEIAEPAYKPSILENDIQRSPPEVKLKAKGVTMQQLFTERHWHVLSFESFTGVYGYMTIFSPKFYYRMLGSLYLLLMFYIAFAVIKKPSRRSISQFAITAFCIGLCILMSLFLSWTYAFQAQGRYLFPALPISATFIYANRRSFNNLFVNGLVFAAFLLSVYSFVFVALPRINL